MDMGGSRMKILSSSYSKRLLTMAGIADELEAQGFAEFDFSALLNRKTKRSFDAFQRRICSSLPVDDYDVTGTRFRRFARYLHFTGTGELVRWALKRDENGSPITGYSQSGQYHPDPEIADIERIFPSLSEREGNNSAVHQIIQMCAEIGVMANILHPDGLLMVGTHWVRLSASEPGVLAAASPNKLHRDGEVITFGILLKRQNCVGGGNLIAVPEAAGKRPDQLKPGEKIRWLQLSQPFEAWVIDDRKISHHVEEIALGPDGTTAERDILLIDFLPQASKLSDDL